MAFENVFGNIDFQAPVRAKQAQFAQMLGMGIDAAQRNRQLDMQERQMEARANEFDLKSAAEKAAYRISMGQEMAGDRQAVEAFQAFQRPMMDNLGNIIQPADILGNLGSGFMPQMKLPNDRLSQVEAMMYGIDGGAPAEPVITPDFRPEILNQPLDYPVPQVDMSEPVIDAEIGGEQPRFDSTIPDAKINLTSKGANSPLGQRIALEKEADLQAKYAEANYAQKLNMQKERFDDLIVNENSLPMIDAMIKFNRNTIDMPYAELLQGGTRFLSSDQADSYELLNQNRLEMAAPLAKQLGVNPTDKDFQASLDRIVNLNATKSGREKQLKNLRTRIEGKIKSQGGSAPVSYMEYFQ